MFAYYSAYTVGREGSIAAIITPLITLMIDQMQSFQHKQRYFNGVLGEAQRDKWLLCLY